MIVFLSVLGSVRFDAVLAVLCFHSIIITDIWAGAVKCGMAPAEVRVWSVVYRVSLEQCFILSDKDTYINHYLSGPGNRRRWAEPHVDKDPYISPSAVHFL